MSNVITVKEAIEGYIDSNQLNEYIGNKYRFWLETFFLFYGRKLNDPVMNCDYKKVEQFIKNSFRTQDEYGTTEADRYLIKARIQWFIDWYIEIYS